MHTNVTIKDIARQMGVSATTVHRALQGKGRISDETRIEVLKTASQMGYRSNYMAASLKRKRIKFAVAFPEPTMENRYYYLSLWKGVRQYLSSVAEFNPESVEFLYPLTAEANGAVMKEIFENESDNIDGVLTIASQHSQSSFFIEKIAKKGIPVVLIGSDLHSEYRFCCVKSYDEVAGRLAAELITTFYPKDTSHKVIVTGNLIGNLTMMDQYDNSNGFENYIKENAPNTVLLRAYNSDTSIAYNQIKDFLLQHPDVFAIYSCSARHTIQMCKAVTELGLKDIKLIGNDSFEESDELLRRGVLTAIIDKRIERQGHIAMQVLFNYVVKGEYPSNSTLHVRPIVILKSNLAAHRMIE